MRRSLAVRLSLFISHIVIAAIALIFNVIQVLMMWEAAGEIAMNPADEYQYLAGKLFFGGVYWLVMTLVFTLILDPLVIYFIYWKYYTNLRNRLNK